MDLIDSKLVLERFLSFHGIEMSPTARLCHYGRRFYTYFPSISVKVNGEGRDWRSTLIAKLAEYVSTLNPSDFQKVVDVPTKKPKRISAPKTIKRSQQFLRTWEWRSLRYEVLKERGVRCEMCGAGPKDCRIEVDHIKPISKFWHLRAEKTNLQVLCRDCNKGKGNRHYDDFRT